MEIDYWTNQWWFVPFLAFGGPLGGPGGPGGFLGGQENPKLSISIWDQIKLWDAGFWAKTTCHTMFLIFQAQSGPLGPKKANLGQNRVCRKVLFPKNCHLKFCSYCTKIHVLDHISIWNIDFFGNPPKIFHDGWFCEFRPKMAKTDMWTLWWSRRVQMVLKHFSHV